ncbi:hypothetical protein Hanom_Chr12g01134631 [Helianthus anomalus]
MIILIIGSKYSGLKNSNKFVRKRLSSTRAKCNTNPISRFTELEQTCKIRPSVTMQITYKSLASING